MRTAILVTLALSSSGCSFNHDLPEERRELATIAAGPWTIEAASRVTGHHLGTVASCAGCGAPSGRDSYRLAVALAARKDTQDRLLAELSTDLAYERDPACCSRRMVDEREPAIGVEHCLASDARTVALRSTGGLEGPWRVVYLFDGSAAVADAPEPDGTCQEALAASGTPRAWLDGLLAAGDPFRLACRVVERDPALAAELAPRCAR